MCACVKRGGTLLAVLGLALAVVYVATSLSQPPATAQVRKAPSAGEKKAAAAAIAAEAAKAALIKEGKYACCIKGGCSMCVLKMHMCPCAGNAAAGKPVCPECYGGWHAGMGALSDVKPEQIKIMKMGGKT